ncbi:MAG: arginine--tRNA ligase, partial [Desulfovibrionales bacterium]
MKSKQIVEDILGEFFKHKGIVWPQKGVVEPPKDKKFGDMASNVALVGSKQAKLAPRHLAEEIREFCLTKESALERIDIAGPGFLNFSFKKDFWRQVVNDVFSAGEDYGRNDFGENNRVQVEYVSAN